MGSWPVKARGWGLQRAVPESIVKYEAILGSMLNTPLNTMKMRRPVAASVISPLRLPLGRLRENPGPEP